VDSFQIIATSARITLRSLVRIEIQEADRAFRLIGLRTLEIRFTSLLWLNYRSQLTVLSFILKPKLKGLFNVHRR
jgi:hypothetical protein